MVTSTITYVSDPNVESELREITLDPSSCPVGTCISLPSVSNSTLIREIVFTVMDFNNRDSVTTAFSAALRTVEQLNYRSVVCNLLGTDMYVQNYIRSDQRFSNTQLRLLRTCIT